MNKKSKAVYFSLKNLCPYCGKGSLYKGYIRLQPKCSSCNASFDSFDSGDGPAFFVNALLCIIAGTISTILEISGGVAYWVHGVIWFVIIFGMTALLLRPTKSLIIGLQTKYDAKDSGTIN